MNYIVKISSKDGNGDIQYVDIKITATDEVEAINRSILYYYSEYWTNVEWNKDKFTQEMDKFRSKLDELNKLVAGDCIDKNRLLLEYESELRKHLGSSDKSLREFSIMTIDSKLNYLSDIGCELNYFVYPERTKFEKVIINIR